MLSAAVTSPPSPQFLEELNAPRLLHGLNGAYVALQPIERGLEYITEKMNLSPQGKQILERWTTWVAYTTKLAGDNPHLQQSPGWSVVLPIPRTGMENSLYRLLMRAGESWKVARQITDVFGVINFRAPNEWMPKGAVLEWKPERGDLKLPEDAGPFETLPAWAREIALFATNLAGKDCRGMPGLSGLDLHELYAPYCDFRNCDLSGCNFLGADLRGADLRGANIAGIQFDKYENAAVKATLRTRSHPPIGPNDRTANGSTSLHGYSRFMGDEEILDIAPLAWKGEIDDIPVGRTQDGKTVIQQQGQRAGTAAAGAMIIYDHGANFDADSIKTGHVHYKKGIAWDIQRAGLKAVTTQVESMEDLKAQLRAAGPAIIHVKDEATSIRTTNSIVVDHIDLAKNKVKIRDPYHGWLITVSVDSLASRVVFPTDITQATQAAHKPSAVTRVIRRLVGRESVLS